MKTNYRCISLEQIIDLVLGVGHQPDMVHLVLCGECMSKFKGLQLSLKMEREKNKTLTNKTFKTQRMEEIEMLVALYGADSIAVDMAIKTGLNGKQAEFIFTDLEIDQQSNDL